jgi:hypothetical protein
MTEKPRQADYSLRTALILRDEWCVRCERAKVNCVCQKLMTIKGARSDRHLGAVERERK